MSLIFSLNWNSAIFTADWSALHCSKWGDISQTTAHFKWQNALYCCWRWCFFSSSSFLSIEKRTKWRNNGNKIYVRKTKGKTENRVCVLSVCTSNHTEMPTNIPWNNKYQVNNQKFQVETPLACCLHVPKRGGRILWFAIHIVQSILVWCYLNGYFLHCCCCCWLRISFVLWKSLVIIFARNLADCSNIDVLMCTYGRMISLMDFSVIR